MANESLKRPLSRLKRTTEYTDAIIEQICNAEQFADVTLDQLAEMPDWKIDQRLTQAGIAEDIAWTVAQYIASNFSQKKGKSEGEGEGMAAVVAGAFDKLASVLTPKKSLNDMTLRELLEIVRAEPDRLEEVMEHIIFTDAWRKAATKYRTTVKRVASEETPLIIPMDGGFDLDATLANIATLGKSNTIYQPKVGEKRLVSLYKALGIKEGGVLHLFTGTLIEGPDADGYDMSKVDNDLYAAIAWAIYTKHRNLPFKGLANYDPLHDDIVWLFEGEEPMPKRWKIILDDFKFARDEDEDQMAQGITKRRWPWLNAATNRSSSTAGSTQETEVAQLVQLSNGQLQFEGVNRVHNHAVYTSISVKGANQRFNDVIILGGGRVDGAGHSGIIYYLIGSPVTLYGAGHTVQIVGKTATQLLEIVRLKG